MSKERLEGWAVWVLRLILPALMSMAWYDLRGARDSITELQRNFAVMQGNRFTSSDWTAASANITAQINLNDKRITRIEDGMERISKALDRIETKPQTR